MRSFPPTPACSNRAVRVQVPTCTISFPRVRSQAPIMRNFLRGVRNSWPYRIRLFLSVAFAILAAVFWSLNFLAIHPAMKILGGAESLAKSVDKDIGDVEHDAVEPNKRLDDLRNEIQVIERWQDGPEKERKRRIKAGEIAQVEFALNRSSYSLYR